MWIPASSYTFDNVSENGHTIEATFVLVYLPNPVLLESTQATYSSMQVAYDVIPEGGTDVIKVKAGEQTGNLVIDRNVNVTIDGGYDSTISNVVSYTILYGTLTITNGTFVSNNLIIN